MVFHDRKVLAQKILIKRGRVKQERSGNDLTISKHALNAKCVFCNQCSLKLDVGSCGGIQYNIK